MGAIGTIIEQRVGLSRAPAVQRRDPLRSLGVPERLAAFKSTTAADTIADRPRSRELPRGRESLTWSSGFSATANVNPAAMDHGFRMTKTDDALSSLRESIADDARLFGFEEAAGFADRIEEMSRSLEYLQVVAAQAVERTRHEAQQAQPGRTSAAAPEWRTGWTDPAGSSAAPATAVSAGTLPAGTQPEGAEPAGAEPEGATPAATAGVLDDGYRNAAEFLRARLRIGIGEARRRLALAAEVLPRVGMTGQDVPARREVLADAIGSALVPSRSATIISIALGKVRHLADEETIARMEQALTTTAIETDPDFVAKMARRWTDLIDQDGHEPSEEALRQLQGAFLRRKRRHGLHHLEIFATAEQYETLTTVMNTATNPRLTTPSQSESTTDNEPHAGAGAGPVLDLRTRAQKLLDGLVGACGVAMSTGKLPSNGGLRAQLTVTIDHRDLFEQLTHQRGNQPGHNSTARNHLSSGTATFLGPFHPTTIRKIACDADILPVLLGSDSRILDIGRTTRIFPPHIRKAITARDGGCAFPDCTMPAPWCEAHHTTYWSHGGTTSTDNGTLLCSHHHHLIHKEQWRIDMRTGVPCFLPPPPVSHPHLRP
ncbi:HNH endonuclease signature motif containing protein, partial [Arthrobacter sp. EpRS71]|uniref:HNH endonuclease signature motif containing protein n=1 Tax=Arthrobacter sp. EpRS71 TaxID=1743141 RepID=UPI000748204F